MTSFDRTVFFDSVRESLFSGSMNQDQVDGMGFILDAWEQYASDHDVRWLANFMAQSAHETGFAMQPVEEHGKGEGQPYGEPDKTTGCAYYGRGYVQLTWASNYQRADSEFGWSGDESCYWHPELQLDAFTAARTGYRGMMEGWFRSDSAGKQTLGRYFSASADDAYGAREIINGDKKTVPSWSHGVSIGNLIKGYHQDFLAALQAAVIVVPEPVPVPGLDVVHVNIQAPPNVQVSIALNGEIIVAGPG